VKNSTTLRTAAAVILLFGSVARAQDDLAQLVANRDHKLASAFFQNAAWKTSYSEAKAAAKASGHLILGYFTRSYAPCGPCLQLEQNVFSKPEFAEFSKCVVLFCHITSRIPSDPDRFLFAEKGGVGFPTLMVLDSEGHVLARQCGERSMQVVRNDVAEGRAFADLICRAEKGDLETRYACLVKRVEYGHFPPDEARARVKELGPLSDDQTRWFEKAITSREYTLAMLDIKSASDDAARIQAAAKLVAMKNAGHIPTDANALPFWDWVMSYAHHTQDARLYEEGFVAMKGLMTDDAESRERLQEKRSVLERMKRDAVSADATVPPREDARP
jgi:hypothetical protein